MEDFPNSNSNTNTSTNSIFSPQTPPSPYFVPSFVPHPSFRPVNPFDPLPMVPQFAPYGPPGAHPPYGPPGQQMRPYFPMSDCCQPANPMFPYAAPYRAMMQPASPQADKPQIEVNMKEAREGLCHEFQYTRFKSSTDQLLPNISINTRLATNILLLEASNGSSAKNVVCSPLSLEFAMNMVAAGTKGKLLSQLLHFLGSRDYPLESMEDLNLKSSRIMKVASSFCKSEEKNDKMMGYWGQEPEKEPELSIANGVWVDQCLELKRSYKELMSSIYDARAETVNFAEQAEQIRGDINSWVDDKTKGLIKDILKPRSIDGCILILVNAIYFKGIWSDSFDEDLTANKDFHLLNGRKVSVPFMSRLSPEYLYGEFDGYRVVQMNYQRGNDRLRQFCMQILLPNEKDGLQNLMNKCISDPSLLQQDLKLKNEKFKEMRIPKFKFTYMNEDIVGMMQSLGLTLPFEPSKDFTEMVTVDDIHVSQIIHKAKIEVNESNTEAAAATVVKGVFGASRYQPPPPTLRFVADHPFMFLIKEVNSGAIFFMGAVVNPLLGDD